MAISLDKSARRCERIALAGGRITEGSSARPLLYDISRQWRRLAEASAFRCVADTEWDEREVAAAEVMIATMAYLRRIGCVSIERLLADTIGRHERHGEK